MTCSSTWTIGRIFTKFLSWIHLIRIHHIAHIVRVFDLTYFSRLQRSNFEIFTIHFCKLLFPGLWFDFQGYRRQTASPQPLPSTQPGNELLNACNVAQFFTLTHPSVVHILPLLQSLRCAPPAGALYDFIIFLVHLQFQVRSHFRMVMVEPEKPRRIANLGTMVKHLV
jgi:hypothetical protein